MTDYNTILVEKRGAVTLVTLNRPQALNALNSEVLKELIEVFSAYDADDSQHCLVLTGSEKAFAAGADIKEMQSQGFADMYSANFFGGWEQVTSTRKPWIAAVAGYALGGGCEVAMMADFIIAADTAKFGQPEIKLGVTPGMGGSQRLAHAVGKDPLAFRRALMQKHPQHLRVLEAAAERGGWGKPAPKGIFRGIAQMKAFNSYVAACAEVSVDGNNVKVHRIVGATDCGYAVNPAQIERQVAGSFVYGLSALFMQENTVKGGRIVEENFNSFDSMRIAQMPKVESIIIPSQSGVWGGIGEPTICVAAPAVLNAIFAATGKRLRTVPLKNLGIQMV